MSTRATIQFKDGEETFFIYKHCDGYPEGVLPDIHALMEERKAEDREISQIATFFLLQANKGVTSFSGISYELTSSEHGDEAYRYTITKEPVDSTVRPRIFHLTLKVERV